jgi:hypothetical protein
MQITYYLSEYYFVGESETNLERVYAYDSLAEARLAAAFIGQDNPKSSFRIWAKPDRDIFIGSFEL